MVATLDIKSSRYVGGLGAIAQAAFRPVDVIMIGDSNQLMDGKGYDWGLSKALATRFGLYASPLYSQDITGGTYTVAGYASQGIASLSNSATTGAPAALDDFRLPMREYAYQASGDMGQFNGVYVSKNAPGLDVTANLRAHYCFGIFASGGGSFVPAARIEASPYPTLVTGSAVSCSGGADSVGYSTLDLTAGARTTDISFKWRLGGGAANVAKTAQLWQRVENLDRPAGVSVHSMYAVGGQSLYDMAAAMLAMTDARIQSYFKSVTRLQRLRGLAPMMVVYINSGFNDRNENLTPSLGPLATGSPTGPLAYIDNLEAIRLKFDAAWVACGYDLANLTYLVVPSHPISSPDDAQVITYRSIVSRYVAGQRRMSMVDLSTLSDYASMVANGWYRGPSEFIHLSQAGYEGEGSIIAAQVP